MSTTIPTPSTAVVAGALDQSDLQKGRVGLAIIDNPVKPDKTYIVFDAIAGNNDLHLDTGVSTTYSINKGDGTVDASHTDTGGIKVLNYAVTGRYTITIEGNFAGIDTSQTVSQTELNKYIQIVAGSNHPTSLVVNAFLNCIKLQKATFTDLVIIGDTVFSGCSLLQKGTFPKVTTIGDNAFLDCDLLILEAISIISLMGGLSGFGTSSTNKKFHANGDIIIGDKTEAAAVFNFFGIEGTSRYANITKKYDAPTDFIINTSVTSSASAFIVNIASGLESFRVSLNNYLGINQDTPTERLHVGGNIKADGDLLATGDLDVDDDVFCDEVNCLNVIAAGNVGGATVSATGNVGGATVSATGNVSEGGTILADKYAQKASGTGIDILSSGLAVIGTGTMRKSGDIVVINFSAPMSTGYTGATFSGSVPVGFRPPKTFAATLNGEGHNIKIQITSGGVVSNPDGAFTFLGDRLYTITYFV